MIRWSLGDVSVMFVRKIGFLCPETMMAFGVDVFLSLEV